MNPKCFFLLAAICLAACNQNKTSDRDLRSIDVQATASMLAGKTNLLGQNGKAGTWVDPRTAAAFDKGHIPDAIHMPFASVRDRHDELKPYRVIIVYGDGYRDVVAEGMAKRLIELGHKDVYVLRGGLQAWTSAGNTLQSAAPTG